MEELERRLRGRGTETDESVNKRLEQAKKEIEFSEVDGVHDRVVVNKDLDDAYQELEAFIFEKDA